MLVTGKKGIFSNHRIVSGFGRSMASADDDRGCAIDATGPLRTGILDPEFPSTVLSVGCVRGAVQTGGTNAGINCLSESFELDYANSVAGKV